MTKKTTFIPLFVLTQAPGCNYYRCVSFAKHIKGAEIWPKQWADRLPNWEQALERQGIRGNPICLEMAKEAARSNIIIMQRVFSFAGLAIIDYFKKELHKKVLVEIDDNVLLIDSSNPAFGNISPGSDQQKRFLDQLETSDGVITSTENLKKIYSEHNKKVFVVKNSIDFGVWDKLKKPGGHSKIRIGWEGAYHHRDDLEILTSVIPKLQKKYGDKIEFHFFGFIPDYFVNCAKLWNMVHINKYPAEYKKLDFDIILAPLVDLEFNRGKSNIRILEAGALKKPVVASANNNLPYAKTIENGKTGLLANTADEWVTAISGLIDNSRLREDLGNNLYRMVKDNFNIKDTAKEYEKILVNKC